MKYLILTFIILPLILKSQDTGFKDFPNLGISFTIPNGWVGAENESGYTIASYTEAGVIIILPHQTTNLDQLKTEAMQGVSDEQGTALTLLGEIRSFENHGIQAEYQGTVSFEPARAYAIGLINPYGTGLTIIAMTTTGQYNDLYPRLAKELAGSVVFKKVEFTASKNQWGETLKNARLTYMHTYSSSSGSYNGYSTGGGFSDKEVIDLCSEGFFNHSSSSSLSIDTGGAFGHSNSRGQGSGTWKVIVNSQGEDVLQLIFYDGKVYDYVLSLQDNKTYLNGSRYFRTYGTTADDGPNCSQ